ncbi:hypothetical protein [Kitasatospora cineracea]|uniref:hypothetical protein n=1 Tax=Kitasatospora cineracea TaxID=88074 RepID=UPI00381350BF
MAIGLPEQAVLPMPMRELITPAAASDILRLTRAHNCNPRRLDPTHAQRLARDMVSGGWDDRIPEIISLCSHGACIQGQHRLEAVVISDLPRSFLVSRDVPHGAAANMDSGKARPMALALGLVGVERGRKEVCSTIRVLHLYDYERVDTPWSEWRGTKYTISEIVRFYEADYRDLPDFLSQMNILKTGLHAAPAASLASAYLISRGSTNANAALEFLEGLASGVNMDSSDPRWVLRRWFNNPSRPRRGSAISALQLGLVLKCWNLWAKGHTWELASMKPSERLPDVLPYTQASAQQDAAMARPRSFTPAPRRAPGLSSRNAAARTTAQAPLPLIRPASA